MEQERENTGRQSPHDVITLVLLTHGSLSVSLFVSVAWVAPLFLGQFDGVVGSLPRAVVTIRTMTVVLARLGWASVILLPLFLWCDGHAHARLAKRHSAHVAVYSAAVLTVLLTAVQFLLLYSMVRFRAQ